ncbi:UDP-N-acetylmuramoyl-tripeptide--D-alanyl-D-alanine ligase [Novosphingobium sp. G106]|uniref:UDP-N-acetylmuramoyl-tripeptide--D-alanyl-D- alanine ligase n=1 Tax=Novosphingobium sp. G106 TaxID=2849500 RepID=UPI001C2D75B4|nr:UDP-N-acetylmuramoyl-tripeptide--D-alanyl-D-alanine ligase [Novosphingobium sp. G106]MBV1689129.1 UDP-N-acetylmuramoyl-tripeptide--D-alanyl-D-alanine ligase [Novosphingobium sp. G106]
MAAVARILDWPVDEADDLPLALWDAISIARAVKGVANADFQVSGVEIDSRDVLPGDLFFALKGENMDGHRFLEMAFAKGAAAAVVDRPVDYPHILVSDTTAALEALAKASRARTSAQIVGVTGSVGKTGVKEAIFAALDRSSRGAAHRSVKSYNNHVGVPLSLARMPSRSRFGIFEMGMNHSGEIAALTRQVRPHVAVVTTIAPAHIEMLGSEEAIADAKGEIFEGVEPGGVAIIPADSPHYARLKAKAEQYFLTVVGFGRSAHADVRLLDTIAAANGGSLVTADMGDRRVCYTIAEPGEHWVMNSLAVMAAVRAAGGDLGAAGVALADMAGLAGRGARVEIEAQDGGHALLIDESYNANPASMRATLAQLGKTAARRRIAVLGSMKELGEHGPAFHAALAQPLTDAHVDFAVLVGDEMKALADELGKSPVAELGKPVRFAHCQNPAEARQALAEFGVESGDAILVKGSNSVGLGALVKALAAKEA